MTTQDVIRILRQKADEAEKLAQVYNKAADIIENKIAVKTPRPLPTVTGGGFY